MRSEYLMIKRNPDMVREIRSNMRGGNGNVEICHIFKPEELKGKTRLNAKITLEPGCSIGLHEHVGEEEIYYILKGIATVNDNGNISTLYPGDAVLTGNGASHSIENNGSETLELMALILLY